jgi:phosphoribosylanthranilate isomerase
LFFGKSAPLFKRQQLQSYFILLYSAMALKTLVKVGKITNLSDARYCSGMGVDMLGFRVMESDANYLRPETFKEFRGWFSGPAVVAEAYGLPSEMELRGILENYQPDYIELPVMDFDKISNTAVPLILSGHTQELLSRLEEITNHKSRIRYLLLTAEGSEQEIKKLANHFELLVTLSRADAIDDLTHNRQVSGIALQGTEEERPGLKNYGLLADVLEKLEVID